MWWALRMYLPDLQLQGALLTRNLQYRVLAKGQAAHQRFPANGWVAEILRQRHMGLLMAVWISGSPRSFQNVHQPAGHTGILLTQIVPSLLSPLLKV
jgi:hypothetical protein